MPQNITMGKSSCPPAQTFPTNGFKNHYSNYDDVGENSLNLAAANSSYDPYLSGSSSLVTLAASQTTSLEGSSNSSQGYFSHTVNSSYKEASSSLPPTPCNHSPIGSLQSSSIYEIGHHRSLCDVTGADMSASSHEFNLPSLLGNVRYHLYQDQWVWVSTNKNHSKFIQHPNEDFFSNGENFGKGIYWCKVSKFRLKRSLVLFSFISCVDKQLFSSSINLSKRKTV